MADTLLIVLAVVLVAVGLAGIVLPALPGPVLVFAGLFLAAWVDNFSHVGFKSLLVIGFLALFTFAVDFGATALGAKKFGAGKRAMIGATLGALVGLLFGLPGLLLGPFVGAVVGEWSVRRNLSEAGRAGLGAWLGLLAGTAGKLAVALVMIGFFLIKRFW